MKETWLDSYSDFMWIFVDSEAGITYREWAPGAKVCAAHYFA